MTAQIQRDFLVNHIIDRLTENLVNDFNMDLTTALRTIYQSKTFMLLNNMSGDLYVQSPSYNYELLLTELKEQSAQRN